jgi:hypothetical protein
MTLDDIFGYCGRKRTNPSEPASAEEQKRCRDYLLGRSTQNPFSPDIEYKAAPYHDADRLRARLIGCGP